MTQILKNTFVLLLALTIFSCSNDEEIGTTKSDPVISQLQNSLHLDKFTDQNISKNLEVNWNDVKKTTANGIEIYEVGVIEKTPTTIESTIFQDKLKYEIIAVKNGNDISSYFIQAYSSLNHDLFPSTIKSLNNFTGTFKVFDLSGKPTDQLVVYNGKSINPSKNPDLNLLTTAINTFYTKTSTSEKISACNSYISVVTVIYADVFNITTFNGQIIGVYFMGERYLGSYVSYMSIPYACDQAGDPFSIIERQTTYRNISLRDLILYDKLDPCPKNVLEQLLYGKTCKIADIINKFNGNISKYNVSVESNDTGNTPAKTNKISDFNYKISLNNAGYTDGTQLFKAANLLHEFVHAYFLSIVDDYRNNQNAPRNYDLSSFPSLFQAFCDKNYPPSNKDAADAHHLEMANQYVDAIASALQEYNKYADPNMNIPLQTYKDLAWGGLIGTPIFDKTFPAGSDNEIRIRNTYAAEQIGKSVNNQNPAGKPCN
jgi:hypothetical protein